MMRKEPSRSPKGVIKERELCALLLRSPGNKKVKDWMLLG